LARPAKLNFFCVPEKILRRFCKEAVRQQTVVRWFYIPKETCRFEMPGTALSAQCLASGVLRQPCLTTRPAILSGSDARDDVGTK